MIYLPEQIDQLATATNGELVRFNRDDFTVLWDSVGSLHLYRQTGFSPREYLRRVTGKTAWTAADLQRDLLLGQYLIL